MRPEIDLDTVVPIPDCLPLMLNETASSYVARLTVYYGYDRMADFCSDFELDRKGIMYGRSKALRHLATLTGADFDLLGAWTPTRLGKFRYEMNGVVVDKDFGPWLQARQCPLCAQASIADNPHLPPDLCLYGRGEWLSGYVETCDIHSVRLMEQRVAPANIELIDPARLQEAIFEDLGDVVVEHSEPTSFERHALSVMRREPRQSLPYVDDLPMPELTRVCYSLGRDVAVSQGIKGVDQRTFRSIGFDILSGGPSCLSEHFAAMTLRKGGTLNKRGILPNVQRYFQNSTNPQVAALCHQVWCIFDGREVSGRLLAAVCPTDLAAGKFVDVQSYPVQWPVIFELAKSMPQLAPCLTPDGSGILLVKTVADETFLGNLPLVPLAQMVRMLGQPRNHGYRLPEILEPSGIISGPFPGTEGLRTGPLYALPTLEREIEAFLSQFQTVDAVPAGMVSLHSAAKVVQTPTVGLMRLLKRGLLKNVVALRGESLIKAIHLDPQELVEVVYGSATVLTSTEAGLQLGVTQSLVGHLIRTGHLASVEGVDAALVKVEQAEVDRFRRRYVTHEEACNATGARSFRGLARLGLERALIIESPWDDQKPKVFYDRDEVERLAVAA
ncbi:TniQ family protein [Devosia sp. 1635]|uniref:TniQ family protein n=1 Tax=Devosia sp. 1635 TaxID=2726066 RepID=UPI001563A2EA|nr:TniQ family protein [Devosia sp. 1635]